MNPLGVHMKVRDFKIVDYWTEQVNKMIDILHIEYFDHGEAHAKSRDYFLKHEEYTHFVFLPDDIIVTPDMVELLLEDARQLGDNCVVCGYSNVDFSTPSVNISFRDLRKVLVMFREQYQHPSLYDVLSDKFSYPFVKVTFQGNTLTIIPRKIVEKLSFKPYKTQIDNVLGKLMIRGSMYDLQMCNELLDLGVDIYCDLRLLIMHFGNTLRLINAKGKTRKMYLKTKNGEIKDYVELPPY